MANPKSMPTPAEPNHQQTCVSASCTPTVLDPSVSVALTPDGRDDSEGTPSPAADGGNSGFTYPTLWEVLTDTCEEVPMYSAMTQLLDQLDSSPAFRRGQVHGALAEIQTVMEQTSHASTGNEQVTVEVGTLVVLAHCLLRHQA